MPQGRTWPSAKDALAIHARLRDDDPVAPSDLASAYLEALVDWLIRTHPRLDPHLCNQAAEDAILSLIKTPQSFQPDRSPLDAYLRMSAKADLRNALGRERRHSRRLESLENVELYGPRGNPIQGDDDPERIVERETDELDPRRRAVLLDNIHTFSGEELCVFELMLEGERRTSVYARMLGLADLPEPDQRKAVKRVKDRIKRRLQRARAKT